MKQAAAWEGGLDAGMAGPPKVAGRARPRFKVVDRGQTVFRTVVIEELIEADHPARAVWDFTGHLDVSGYSAPVKAVEGVAGPEPWDVRLMASLWIYAYSRGIGSAREIARRCGHDPAFQWLTGLKKINYHTLADFRVAHQAALDGLFAQVHGVLSAEGLVSLERVMHDGTKIRAYAGVDSFRREERLEAHLKAARAQVAAMGDPRHDTTPRQKAARERARRERAERLEQARRELEKIRAVKPKAESKEQARVSLTESEARIMKQGDGGYAPSYNAQISTEASNRCIVGAGLTQAGSDYTELPGAMERVQEQAGKLPAQAVVDGGFTSRENIEVLAGIGVDLIGSLADRSAMTEAQMRRRKVDEAFYPAAFSYEAGADQFRCPAGKALLRDAYERRRGVIQRQYRADPAECMACAWKERCCPNRASQGRTLRRAEESAPVSAFIEKMQTDAAKALYRLRGAVAEFSNAWIKEKIGLRKFHVRGLAKARSETMWACLTYNVQQWIRLRWRVRHAAPA